MTTSLKPKTKPIPVRLDQNMRDRTDRAAKRLGITRAAVLKLSLSCKLGEIESGTLNLH